MSPVQLSVSVALVFFVVIPSIGVVATRARWRSFRRTVVNAALIPHAGSRTVHAAYERDGEIGEYRFLGVIEALQADDRLWIRNGNSSVEIEMTNASVCLLPDGLPPQYRSAGDDRAIGFESLIPTQSMPEIVPWSRMSSLTEGTSVFVSGRLVSEHGVPVFRGVGRRGPLVIMYDGPPTQLLARAIWFGRHRNEYWNALTPPSLIAGMLILVIVAVRAFSVAAGYAAGILTLGLAAVPVLPLMPPGVIGYFVYRRLWLKGRAQRAWRDLLRLPLLYSRDGSDRVARLPDGEPYLGVEIGSSAVDRYLSRGAVLRTSTGTMDAGRWMVFGSPIDGDIGRPSDPMAEFVILPVDPAERSRRSAIFAYLWELVALSALGAAMLVNFAVLIRLLPLVL